MVKTPNNDQEWRQYWTPINEKRREERKVCLRNQRGETACDPTTTVLAIWDVAHEVKLPTKRVEWVIEQYAENNPRPLFYHRALTARALEHIGRSIVQRRQRSAGDLSLLKWRDDIEKLSALIGCIRDEFFFIEKADGGHSSSLESGRRSRRVSESAPRKDWRQGENES